MIDLNKLAAEIHAAAVEKGFWDVEDAHAKHIAKMHSELSEAVQADRAGIMYEVERDGAKPEGVAAELADFVMMVLDWAAAREEMIASRNEVFKSSSTSDIVDFPLPSLVNNLHEGIVLVSNGWVACEDVHFAFMVHCADIWLEERGYDLWQIIRQKMEYNKSRPKLHGRAY